MGPTSTNTDADDYSTTSAGLKIIRENAVKSVPNMKLQENIRTFAGLRARSDTKGFIIGEDKDIHNFFLIAGMASPGLSSASAIALDIVRMMQEKDYFLNLKKNYVSTRKVVRFKEMSHEQRKEYIEKHPEYGRIICRCETISEGEILDAIRRSPKPVSLDGIKRRCNAGMGRGNSS